MTIKKLGHDLRGLGAIGVFALTLAIQCSLTCVGVHAQAPTATTSSRSVIPAPKAPATLAELRSRIEEICRQPALEPGFFALKIGSLDSALTINDNAIDLNIKPGATVGAPVTIVTGPPNASFITIVNRATTAPKGLKSNLQIYRGLGANTLEISGTLPLGDAGFVGGVAIP